MKLLRKIGARFLDRLLDIVIGAIAVAVAGVAAYVGRHWLLAPTPILPIVPVGLGILALVALVFVVLLYRSRRRREFKPFRVHEMGMNVYWLIQENPNHWIDADLSRSGPPYTDSLLEGPYCAAVRRDGRPCLGRFVRIGDTDHAYMHCDICGHGMLEKLVGKRITDDSKMSLSVLKLRVLHAIQREVRRGHKLRGKFRGGLKFELLDADHLDRLVEAHRNASGS